MGTVQKDASGLSELKVTDYEEGQNPLSLFTKRIDETYIEGGQEHKFKPFTPLDHSGNIMVLIPAMSEDYIWLPR